MHLQNRRDRMPIWDKAAGPVPGVQVLAERGVDCSLMALVSCMTATAGLDAADLAPCCP